MLKFLKALTVFAGTIIGVGIFGLPYVALKAGFLPVLFYFIILSALALAVHLIWGRIALGTEKIHRLPGYFGEYLGDSWRKFFLLVTIFGLGGALLAYLIVGGEFLTFLFSPYFGGSALLYTLIFFGAGAYLIFRGIKSIAIVELILFFLFLAIVAIFFYKAYPLIDTSRLKEINLAYLALPYGVVLFSLWGSVIVPELKEMVGGEPKMLNNVIGSGIIISAIIYLFFTFFVFGASGPLTSEEAISGLAKAVGDNIIQLGFIFGIVTTFTSFLTLGLTLKKTLWYDLSISPNISWFIACFAPLAFFLLGFRAFIPVIGLVGALAIGAEGVMIVFLYKRFLEKRFARKPHPFIYGLPAFFLLGIAFEILYFVLG